MCNSSDNYLSKDLFNLSNITIKEIYMENLPFILLQEQMAALI